jgi:hypothetical protein
MSLLMVLGSILLFIYGFLFVISILTHIQIRGKNDDTQIGPGVMFLLATTFVYILISLLSGA